MVWQRVVDASPLSSLWTARACVLAVIVLLLVPSGVSAVTHEPLELERGTIEEPADGDTVIAVQGFKLSGQQSDKKPARLVGVQPDGDFDWWIDEDPDVSWFYDVDPLEDGNLLVTGVNRDQTIVFEYDPDSDERVWIERFDLHDTHDVDLINGDELLISNMRNYNESTEKNDEGLLIYNRTQEAFTWEWNYRSIYGPDDGGNYEGDWTHSNDVDKIDDGRYLASPRNMDEVLVVNRSTKDVEMRLGEEGNHSILYEQHNPDYLENEDGDPTLIVADSENDRIVEYEMVERGNGSGNSEWERTWELGTEGKLNWPRDADRLPNGNTLVTDSLNHRVIEVTPTGQVVWEYYAPWGTYDAERAHLTERPRGPTIADQGAAGAYALNGSAGLTPGANERPTFAQWLSGAFAGTPISEQVDWVAARWSHIVPWIRPVWMGPWDFVAALGAGLLALGWAGGEVVTRRRRIKRRARDLLPGDGPGGADSSADDDADRADEDAADD